MMSYFQFFSYVNDSNYLIQFYLELFLKKQFFLSRQRKEKGSMRETLKKATLKWTKDLRVSNRKDDLKGM